MELLHKEGAGVATTQGRYLDISEGAAMQQVLEKGLVRVFEVIVVELLLTWVAKGSEFARILFTVVEAIRCFHLTESKALNRLYLSVVND